MQIQEDKTRTDLADQRDFFFFYLAVISYAKGRTIRKVMVGGGGGRAKYKKKN